MTRRLRLCRWCHFPIWGPYDYGPPINDIGWIHVFTRKAPCRLGWPHWLMKFFPVWTEDGSGIAAPR